ncbi:MAG: hypothetical protein AB7V56_09075 [Candidatus Nitrosocosmicus sp.]
MNNRIRSNRAGYAAIKAMEVLDCASEGCDIRYLSESTTNHNKIK